MELDEELFGKLQEQEKYGGAGGYWERQESREQTFLMAQNSMKPTLAVSRALYWHQEEIAWNETKPVLKLRLVQKLRHITE